MDNKLALDIRTAADEFMTEHYHDNQFNEIERLLIHKAMLIGANIAMADQQKSNIGLRQRPFRDDPEESQISFT